MDKSTLKNSIENLKQNIEDLKMIGTTETDGLLIDNSTLPGLTINTDIYDYEKDIELIKDEAEETLECISSLYLTDDVSMNKNINRLIKNDAEEISDIKFSLSCAKRGLISCMRQLDAGSNDPEMHTAVNAYQKEIRESNKMIHDLLNKMKVFYRDLRDELKTDDDINVGNINPGSEGLKLVDKNEFNELIDKYKSDPTLLK